MKCLIVWLHCQVCLSPFGFVVCFCVFVHTNQQSLTALFHSDNTVKSLGLDQIHNILLNVLCGCLQYIVKFWSFYLMNIWSSNSWPRTKSTLDLYEQKIKYTDSIPAQTHISHIHSYMNIQTKYYLLIVIINKILNKHRKDGAETVCL